MTLLDQLEHALHAEESYFRGQLLREDLERLRQLRALAGTAANEAAFLRDGILLEWTPSALRNAQLKETLDPVLRAFFAAERTPGEPNVDARLLEAWRAFDKQRMELLLGCLSRIPRPDPD